MFAIIAWVTINGAPVKGNNGLFVATDEVYKSVPAEHRVFRFSAESDGKFVITVRFWKDGEYWQKVITYNPGKHTITINLDRLKDAELIPTRGMGKKPTIINVKPSRRILLSDVEVM